LVSVRDAWEAGEALAGGADVIDVKEPSRGSLGAASGQTRRDIRLALAAASGCSTRSPIPLSAACGELADNPIAEAATELDGYSFAKVGLAGCSVLGDWQRRWQEWMATLPALTAPVAVIYADFELCGAPSPWEILEAAAATPARTMLVDTCQKSGRSTLDWLTACELVEMIHSARATGFLVALAGSITVEVLADILRFEPDWIAVRGGVCRTGRESRLDRELVKRFATRLSTPSMSNVGAVCNQMVDSTRNRA
jgi:uncharacterized protein (UPF0264 family)